MSTKLYVSNLPLSATAEVLAARFCKFGGVISVALDPAARANRRSAIVEMDTRSAAHNAIAALNLSDLDGKLISVFVALGSGAQKAS